MAVPPPEDRDRDPNREPATHSRRRFLAAGGAAALGLGGARLLGAQAAAAAADAAGARAGTPPAPAPVRPPSAPLLVRSPYLSTWQPSTFAAGTAQTLWDGTPTELAGIALIDGVAYRLAGDPEPDHHAPRPSGGGSGLASPRPATLRRLRQLPVTVTATRTVYTLQGGGMQLTLEYLSPIEPGDLRRQSIPLAWVLVGARSLDGRSHRVALYLEVGAGWLAGDRSTAVTATRSATPGRPPLLTWSLRAARQRPLTEIHNRPGWGSLMVSSPQLPGTVAAAGSAPALRARFLAGGTLAPGPAGLRGTIGGGLAIAFALSLGRVGRSTQTRQLSLAHVRTPLVSYLGAPLAPLWTRNWRSPAAMLAFAHGDRPAASRRADALDGRVAADARAAGGPQYAALCALSLRQAYGATELAVGPDGTPWAFLKEISSDGDMSTVDVLFPASPAWLYLDPGYLAALLAPLLAFAASGRFGAPYAPHDLGHYPNASGYPADQEEAMPVEESGNLLILAAAYARAAGPAAAAAFLTPHYPLLKQWADYLVSQLPDPGYQNQTDDFAGRIADSVNLALKGIVGVGAMGRIAAAVGQTADAGAYAARAGSLIAAWQAAAQDPAGGHLDLAYRAPGTWGTTYNAYADALLGTGLVPAAVAAEQAAFYGSVLQRFGLPLQTPHRYAKTDWQLWTAAWLGDTPLAGQLISRVYAYANTTRDRIPFSDLYDTTSARAVTHPLFRARPVQGGVFAPLALRRLRAIAPTMR